MSDWDVYEIEEVVWDVFSACSDHLVPRPSLESDKETKDHHDYNKKARNDLRSSIDEMTNKTGFGECDMFQDNEQLVFSSSLEDYQSNVDHPHDISSSHTGIGYAKDKGMEMKNCDGLDYEWPEFEDFEDVDQMFRHGYARFGQGNSVPANEPSWFSSSYAIDDSEVTLKSSMQSPCSKFDVLKTCSNHHVTDMSSWPEKVATINDYEVSCIDYDAYGQWLDADAQNNLVSEKMPNDFGIDGSRLSSTINNVTPNCMDTDVVSHVVNSERNIAADSQFAEIEVDQNSGYFSGSYNSSGQLACYDNKLDNHLESSTQESCTTRMVGDLNHSLGMRSSNYLPLHGSNLEVVHSESSQILMQLKPHKQPLEIKPLKSNEFVDQTLSKSGKFTHKMIGKVENLSPTSMKLPHRDVQQNAHSSRQIGSSEWKASKRVSTKSNTDQNKLNKLGSHTVDDSKLEVGETAIAFSTLETKNPSVQGSSSTTTSGSMSDSSSLQKLQEVMSQLDLKTKLCIRDGLYRLARNAKQRHNPDIVRYGCKEEMMTSNIMVANDPYRCPRLLYEETGTNPIDRSIAHLLFYKAAGHCVGSFDDAMSA